MKKSLIFALVGLFVLLFSSSIAAFVMSQSSTTEVITPAAPAPAATPPAPASSTESTPAPAPASLPTLIPSNSVTPYDTENGGNMIYMDRHDVACPDKAGMSRFHFQRDGKGKFAEEYACLSGSDFSTAFSQNTPANDW